MQETEFYQQVLGLSAPCKVVSVKLDVPAGQVRVQLEHAASVRWKYPECERDLACYDHSEERSWRHLDTCQLQTLLVARLPWVQCPEHGVKQVCATWAQPHGRFTPLFERFAIDVLLATQTVKNEKIVIDRFHVMQHLTTAVDTVRKQEHRELLGQGNESLKKTKYLWLSSEENVPEMRRNQFESLKELNLRTGRAWAITESLRELWSYRRKAWGKKFFDKWYGWASRSQLEPMKQAAFSSVEP